MSAARIRTYLIKLKLLEMRDTYTAQLLDDLCLAPIFNDDKEVATADLEEKLKSFEDRYEFYSKRYASTIPSGETAMNSAEKNEISRLQQEVVDSFHKALIQEKRCDHCGAFSPPIRKDGYTKIFVRPLQKKLRKSMTAMKFKYKVCMGRF